MIKRLDLLLCALVAVVLPALTFASAPSAARAPIALALILLLSGWATVAMLQPSPPLALEEHLTFGIALSLATAILGGLALNVTPWGLSARTWSLYEAGVTLAAAASAAMRRYERPRPRLRRPRLGAYAASAMTAGAVALVVVAVLVSRSSLLSRPTESFTQFSIRATQDGGRPVALLQVQSVELQQETYSVRVVRGATTVDEWHDISLAPGHEWQAEVALPAAGDQSQPLQALLYRADEPGTPYRSVSLDAGAARVSP